MWRDAKASKSFLVFREHSFLSKITRCLTRLNARLEWRKVWRNKVRGKSFNWILGICAFGAEHFITSFRGASREAFHFELLLIAFLRELSWWEFCDIFIASHRSKLKSWPASQRTKLPSLPPPTNHSSPPLDHNRDECLLRYLCSPRQAY